MNSAAAETPRFSPSENGSLAEQLAHFIGQQVSQAGIASGARLPSVRECARRHGVSPSTVVAAYDRLQAQGLIEARKQRGFFVRQSLRAGQRTAAARQVSAVPTPLPLSATALIRGMFQRDGAVLMPGLGTLPVQWLDSAALAAAYKRVTTSASLAASVLQYGEPAGDSGLREALSTRLAEYGIAAGPERIVTTLGATQALDIVTRTLTRPGDAVIVDEPGWSVEYARLGALGLRVLPVPRGEDGPDLAVMERLITAHQPRLYVTVSVLHNPTSASLTLAAAHRILGLAQAHGLTVVEDDTYAAFAPAHSPRLAALDALEHSVYIGGFSKILAPGLRVGFLAAPAALVDRLVDTKLLTTLTTPAVNEQVLAQALGQGLLRRHAERVAERLAQARSRSVRLAQSHGVTFAAPPRGLFGWVDVGVDTERLAQAMFPQGWLLAPGALFHATHRPTTLMRINFAATQDARFWRALESSRSALK